MSRRGFTLVELLVVIAVIAMLVAILLPAVQAAREAARRITCTSHMKQITLAVLSYANASEDELPPVARWPVRGGDGRPVSVRTRFQTQNNFGWTVSVLPFLEEQAIYDQFDFSQDLLRRINQRAVSAVLPVLQCPSTSGYPRKYPMTVRGNDYGGDSGGLDYSVSANPGSGPLASLYAGDIAAAFTGYRKQHHETYRELEAYLISSGIPPDEIFFASAPLRWITDGLSKTTALFERAGLPMVVRPEGEIIFAPGWSSWAQAAWFGSGAGHRINVTNRYDESRFSFHPGGANNAKLDGSVKLLSEDTDLKVLHAIDTRAGGEAISDE